MQTLLVNTDTGVNYWDLATAEAALPATLADDYTIECAGAAVSGAVTFSGTTLNGYSVTVKNATGQEHNGVVNTGLHRIRDNVSYLVQLYYDITFEGIQFNSYNASDVSAEIVRAQADITLHFDKCIFWFDTPYGDQQDAIYTNTKNVTINVTNCIAFNTSRCFIDFWGGTWSFANVYNSSFYNVCTVGNSRYGVVGGDSNARNTATIKNCACHTPGTHANITICSGVNTMVIENCITNKGGVYAGSGSPPTLANNIIDATFTDDNSKSSDGNWVIVDNITSWPYDLGLQDNTYNEAIGAGQDLSGTFTDDITGAVRSTPWDIGAFVLTTNIASSTADSGNTIIEGVSASGIKAVTVSSTEVGQLVSFGQPVTGLRTLSSTAEPTDTVVSGVASIGAKINPSSSTATAGFISLEGNNAVEVYLGEEATFTFGDDSDFLFGDGSDFLFGETIISSASPGFVSLLGEISQGYRHLLSAANKAEIALSGFTTTFLYHEVSIASAGDLVLAGENSVGLRNLISTADQGTISTQGVTAQGLRTLISQANQRQLGVLGVDTTELYHQVSNAFTGEVSILGSTTQGLRHLIDTANTGDLVVIGTPAEGYRILFSYASSNGFIAEGNNTTHLYHQVSVAETGNLVVGGSTATGLRHLQVVAPSGEISLEGIDATALKFYGSVAEAGAITFEGIDTTKTQHYISNVPDGVVGILGQPTNDLQNFVSTANPGTTVLQGQDTINVEMAVSVAAAGLVVLEGKNTSVIEHITSTAAKGSLVVVGKAASTETNQAPFSIAEAGTVSIDGAPVRQSSGTLDIVIDWSPAGTMETICGSGGDVVLQNTTDIVNTNTHCVEVTQEETTVEVLKKEYSIVGDALYASINAEDAPQWLTDIIDSVVDAAVTSGLVNYDALVQDVQSAIAALDVAANTYVEQINFAAQVDAIVASHLTTLNATLGTTYATIVSLNTAVANADFALTQAINDLTSAYTDEINSQITTIQTAYTDADTAIANDIASLTTAFTDQESNITATADAVSGLQTYIGLDTNGDPDGTGILSSITSFSTAFTNLENGVTGPAGDIAYSLSNLEQSSYAYADAVGISVENKFEYSSAIGINDIYYTSSFGLVATATGGDGTEGNPYSSEFWIDAQKFKFTNSAQTGTAAPFTIDASGANPQITFNGLVIFGNNQTGTIDEAIAAVVETVSVGDKNINITDNLIPITSFVADTNHSGYQLVGTPVKSNAAGIDVYAEPQALLDGSSEIYSPYVDDLTGAYYYRFGFKGTDLSSFKIVTLDAVDAVTYDTVTVNLDESWVAADWYIIDGIINPVGGDAAGLNGSVRKADGTKVGTVQNYALSAGSTKLLLGWQLNCTVSRMKLASITGDTLMGDYASFDYVDNSLSNSLINSNDDLAQRLGYTNYADLVAAATSGNTIISGGYLNTDLLEVGIALTSSDGLFSIDMGSKLLHSEDGSGNYVQITPGDLQFYQNNKLYKAVRRVVADEATSGSPVVFSPPFKSTPKVLCSLRDLQVFDESSAGVDQYLEAYAEAVTPEGFIPRISLTLGASSGYLTYGSYSMSPSPFVTTTQNISITRVDLLMDIYHVAEWNGSGEIYDDYYGHRTIKVEYKKTTDSVYTLKGTYSYVNNRNFLVSITELSGTDAYDIQVTLVSSYTPSDTHHPVTISTYSLTERREYTGDNTILYNGGMSFIAIEAT